MLDGEAVEHIPEWLIMFEDGIAKSDIRKHLRETAHVVDPRSAFRILLQAKNKRFLVLAETVSIHRKQPPLVSRRRWSLT